MSEDEMRNKERRDEDEADGTDADENQNAVKEPELRIVSYSGPDPPSETDVTV